MIIKIYIILLRYKKHLKTNDKSAFLMAFFCNKVSITVLPIIPTIKTPL